jgi:hypothetical protein
LFASIAGVALALQSGVPARALIGSIPLVQQALVQEIRYRRYGHPLPLPLISLGDRWRDSTSDT